jgi:hypothetical protein
VFHVPLPQRGSFRTKIVFQFGTVPTPHGCIYTCFRLDSLHSFRKRDKKDQMPCTKWNEFGNLLCTRANGKRHSFFTEFGETDS